MQIEQRYTLGFDSVWDVEGILRALKDAKSIVLVAHTNADGDAVGSVCGTYHLLTLAIGATVTPMLPDGVPDDLNWLPGCEHILSGACQADLCREAVANADLIVGLDLNGFGRTGALEASLRDSSAYKILIDHHISPVRDSFDIVVSEPHISSTCELVYWLMRTAFGLDVFNLAAATCLYAGICTDTGTFSYSNDHQSVYLAAADLLAFGIDPMAINRNIKNIFTEERFQFFGFAIAERLTVYRKQKIALMVLSRNDMESHGVSSPELTGLINEVMKLKDIDCGILIREEDGKVRLSLRSKSIFDVNAMANELFGGGGHTRAAGATSTMNLDETVALVKQRLDLD